MTVIVRKWSTDPTKWIGWRLDFDEAGRPVPGQLFRSCLLKLESGAEALRIATRFLKGDFSVGIKLLEQRGVVTRLDKEAGLAAWQHIYKEKIDGLFLECD